MFIANYGELFQVAHPYVIFHVRMAVSVWEGISVDVPQDFLVVAAKMVSKSCISFNPLYANVFSSVHSSSELYQSLRRPSTFSNIFSSETTGPIELKFHMETP